MSREGEIMSAKKGTGEKRCVHRHRRMSAASADRVERYWERLERRAGKREALEQLEQLDDDTQVRS